MDGSQRLYTSTADQDGISYLVLPDIYTGSHLHSYGGYLNYSLTFIGEGSPLDAPQIIIKVSIG